MAGKRKQKPAKGVEVRQQAVNILLKIIEDYQSLDSVIEGEIDEVAEVDRPLLQLLCYGVMRWQHQLHEWLIQLSDRPASKLKPEVRVLILLGLYQLKYTRIPPHAAIHATVECAPALKAPHAKGLVNAVLRQFQRLQDRGELLDNEATRYSHPDWMIEQIKQDWPDDWQYILENNNQQAPMVLRVDTSKVSRPEYIAALSEKNISASEHQHSEFAIVLEKAVNVTELPDFDEGLVSVQDAAAQLAVPLLKAESQHRILDACAAPGGKTAQILQQVKPHELHAMDNSQLRLEKLQPLFERIGASATVIVGDASRPDEWWDGRQYERILLDAPCSASGVIRRHPDIKHLRSAKALQKIAKRQSRILDAIWTTLASGGRMLYATCSIFKVENEQQVSAFLQRHEDASLEEIQTEWGRGTIGRQILPGDDGMDGFYFAVLNKQ